MLLYSWGLSVPLGEQKALTYSDLLKVGKECGLSPNTITTHFHSFGSDKFLSFVKEEGFYRVVRSSLPHTYKGVPFHSSQGLTSLETVLLAALFCGQVHKMPALTLGELASRTGYSRRQVVRQMGSLSKKGLLTPYVIKEESFICNKRGGPVEKTRDRLSYRLAERMVPNANHRGDASCGNTSPPNSPYCAAFNNVSPQEYNIKPSNIKNITDYSSDFSKLQNSLKPHWEQYCELFSSEGESFNGTIALFKSRGGALSAYDDIEKAILQAKSLRFLRIANSHNWQEAVVGCYEATGQGIGTSSRHIDKYYRGRMTFLWIIRHVQEIVAGKYSQKNPSGAQHTFSNWEIDNQKKPHRVAPFLKPVGSKSTVSVEKLLKDVDKDPSKTPSQRSLHKSLLETVGGFFYQAWCKNLTVDRTPSSLIINAESLFMRDAMEQRLCLIEGVEVQMKDGVLNPSVTRFEAKPTSSMQSLVTPPIKNSLACPPYFHTILRENIPETASVLHCSGSSFFLKGQSKNPSFSKPLPIFRNNNVNYLHLSGTVCQAPLISRNSGEKELSREQKFISKKPPSLRSQTLVSATTIAFFQVKATEYSSVEGQSPRLSVATHKVRCIGDKYLETLKKLSVGTEVEIVGKISSSSYTVHGKRQEMSDILIDEEGGSIQISKSGGKDAE